MRILEVFSAHETSVDQPSNMGPFGLPMMGYMWSQVQRVSKPTRSAVTPIDLTDFHSVNCGHTSAPILTSPTMNPPYPLRQAAALG